MFTLISIVKNGLTMILSAQKLMLLTPLFFVVSFFFSPLALAKFEVGLGMSAVSVPHYIGSSESEQYYLPFPYLRYRGEKISIDRNLIQGNMWRSGNWSLELSLGGAVKVDSDKSTLRQGMDDLDFIIEAGPALHYYFLGDRTKDNALFLELPIRYAVATDFIEFGYQGFTVSPRAIWRRGYMMGQYEVRPQLAVSIRNANSEYHDYIYGVESQFVTPNRAEYQGKSGYGGWQLGYSTAVLWQNYLVAGFLRYVNIKGAVYEDSPLVDTDHSLVIGFAGAYLFE